MKKYYKKGQQAYCLPHIELYGYYFMKTFFYSLLLSFLFSCSLTEPCYLIIQNDSKYDLSVNIDNGTINKLYIEKGKSDFILTCPGDIKLIIYIEEINYQKEYNITLNYLEKKKFIFNLE